MNQKLLNLLAIVWIIVGVTIIPIAFFIAIPQMGDFTLIGIKYDNCKQLLDDTVYFVNYTDIMQEVQKQLNQKNCTIYNMEHSGRL